MLFVTETVKEEKKSTAEKYNSTLVVEQYNRYVAEIEGTKTDNRIVRKRNLQQIMQESFFYGSNRFGNNFIA